MENNIVKFKSGSRLDIFLQENDVRKRTTFLLKDVLLLLRLYVKENRLYDLANASIVLCDVELQKLFDRRAFHLSELLALVFMHLENTTTNTRFSVSSIPKNPGSFYRGYAGNRNIKFGLQPVLLSLFKTATPLDDTVFAYEKILDMLFKYIRANRARLVDPSNPKIAVVKDDELGAIFRCTAFHLCQVGAFIEPHLLPVSLRQASGLCIIKTLRRVHFISELELPVILKEYLTELALAP